jgi:hypothetical protein
MITQKFLVTVQLSDRTRFNQDEESLRRELRAQAERIFADATQGPLPHVLVTTPVNHHQTIRQ